nr:plasminogen activator, urokinase b [Misgurnus anguillicaudatus]XP_055033107.1 plasminogen activator, urokinase b [Misgurnus anguillicaudatus]
MPKYCMLCLILALTALTVCKARHKRHLKKSDESVSCFDGDGRLYRGSLSETASGQTCLRWNSKLLHEIKDYSRKHDLGSHNHCRNPDNSSRPWCYVRTPFGISREDCDIPRCPNHGWQCGLREERHMKVVGGGLSTVQRHPWMAMILMKRSEVESLKCGGSLISPCWVLTATHCFSNGPSTNLSTLSVYLGKNAVNETDLQREQKFRVSELIIHENFDNTDGNYKNDIALLKIQSSDGGCAKESSSVKTVCIPDPKRSPKNQMSCNITGYGREDQGSPYNSQYLKEAKVNVLSHDLCSSKIYYGNKITKNMLCAGSEDWSTDSCRGDSGGPLVCDVSGRAFQFGVVSWGEGCSKKFRPGIYTKVSNYYKWILKKTGLSSLSPSSDKL